MSRVDGSAPAAILAALETETASFEGYLAGLSEQDLGRSSACDGWTNADVVAHLTWAAGYFGDLLERALRGDLTQPALPPPGPDRRRLIAELASAHRRELGDSLRGAFAAANRSLYAAFARVGPGDWDRPTAHRIGSIRRLAQSRLNELAVHCWDIRSVLEPPGHLTDSSLPILIDLVGRWFERLFVPDTGQARDYCVRFRYPAGDIAAHDLVIRADGVAFGPASDQAADLLMHCRPEVTVLLAMGRIDPARAAERFGLTLSGRTELVGLLRARFDVA